MKKNISINISGIIFHIEEDGYDRLKNYLDSINKYFASFEDSSEITSDIESRIAEIFLGKLTEDKQVITADDVEVLITTMGSIEDFQAIEDTASESQSEEKSYSEPEYEAPRELKRDNKRKVLGGVCAGVANYFNIDPLWIRLLTLVLFLGSYGGLLIIYIILWLVLPSTDNIKENKNAKKMFRNPDDKVIAGVASGVATYFAVDIAVIRVLFVLFGLFGPGIIIYIILWIVLPEASSITDKVQMQGEPVTLSNIESNVKESLNVREGERENVLVKILLFPFRLIAAVINGLGRALGPLMVFLVEFIRIFTGVIMTIVGLALIFSLLVTGGVFLGIVTGGTFFEYSSANVNGFGEPVLMFLENIPSFSVFVASIVALVPPLFLILLGVSIVAKRIVFNSTVGWTLFGLFLAGAIYLSINIPGIAFGFHEQASREETRDFTIPYSTAVLEVDRNTGLDDYNVTSLYIRGHEEENFRAVLEYSSNGASRSDALEHTEMIEYNIVLKDSILVFDNNISFKDNAKFKFQELDMDLYIPYNTTFVMDRTMREIMSYRSMERHGYRKSQINDENRWMFTEAGLECLTCERYDEGFERANRGTVYSRIIEVEGFTGIELNSPISIEVKKSDDYKVEILGQQNYVNDVSVTLIDNQLDISYEDRTVTRRNFTRSRDAVKVVISMPSLTELDLNQSSVADIRNFEEESLEVKMSGAAEAFMDIDVKRIDFQLNGSSKLTIAGSSEDLTLEANGNSEYEGFRFRSLRADVTVRGASSAEVYAREEIKIERDIASSVRYQGGAQELETQEQQ